LFRFATRGECAVPPVQPPVRVPSDSDRGARRAALSFRQRWAEKRMMAILPGGFDEPATQMRVAGFGDRAAGLFGTAGMFGRDEPVKAMTLGALGKRRGSPNSAAIVRAVRSSTPRKQRKRSTRAQRFEREQVTELGVDRVEAGDGFVNAADIGAMRLLERGQRPALGLKPVGMALRPGSLGRCKPATVS
jgi:hypothetical protein